MVRGLVGGGVTVLEVVKVLLRENLGVLMGGEGHDGVGVFNSLVILLTGGGWLCGGDCIILFRTVICRMSSLSF